MRSEPETSTSEDAPTWDIFCAVVDNYGDIGVCWRLARQLAAEYGFSVRLWLDDLPSLKKICPELDAGRNSQKLGGVQIRRWLPEFPPQIEPFDVVVEAFACQLPDSYIQAMAAHPPVWINLEYLSGEAWIKECHTLASPHPRLPLIKYFFFPGFEPGTGGLLAERGLQEDRQYFLSTPDEQTHFWRQLGLKATEEELRVSLFCYDHAPVQDLLGIWAQDKTPVTCIIPEGIAAKALTEFFAAENSTAGTEFKAGSLTVRIYPFLEQSQFDRLLWSCQLNFVRGEDSFVRAQWAARPLVWQIYPQKENAHWPKLAAFLDNYRIGMTEAAAHAYITFVEEWNHGRVDAHGWQKLREFLPEVAKQAALRPEKLLQVGDLARNLVNFCKNRLQ